MNSSFTLSPSLTSSTCACMWWVKTARFPTASRHAGGQAGWGLRAGGELQHAEQHPGGADARRACMPGGRCEHSSMQSMVSGSLTLGR